jgi:hypothetical protein
MTFKEEIAYNNPATAFKWVANNYRETGLYEWETFLFANTHLVTTAATHFKNYGRYNDIDPLSDPAAWKEWWDRWEYRRKFGMTLPIKVPKGGAISDKDLLDLWVPPAMCGHCNFGPIDRAKNPDDEISITDALKNEIEIKEAQRKEAELENLFAGLSDRKFVELTYDFPDFYDGHYHTWLAIAFAEKLGLDINVLKARRKGFSYLGAWDAFDTFDMQPRSLTLLIAWDLKYLTKADGIFTFVKKYADFMNKHTDWAKGRIIDTQSEIKSGFHYSGSAEEYGFLSRILCLSAKDNASCARGKLARKIKWEECGTFPNLLETVEATSAAAENGGYIVGQSTYWGTVGSDNAEYKDLRKLFYKPEGYSCLQFNNIYDKNRAGQSCGMFFGQLQNYQGAIDKDGNSDFALAEKLHTARKENKKEHAGANEYSKWVAERPMTPAEALNRKTNSIFNQVAIEAWLTTIQTTPRLNNFGRAGQLFNENGKIRLITNSELEALQLDWHPPVETKYLDKNDDVTGCIVEYYAPYTVTNTTDSGEVVHSVPKGLYYIWHDPFAFGKTGDRIKVNKDSLGATYVYEKANGYTQTRGDKLVASYIGKPESTDAYNHQLLYLAMYYNTREGLAFENDRGEVYPYFKKMKAVDYLMEEPTFFSNKELSSTSDRKKGISMTAKRKVEAIRMLKETLDEVVYTDPDTGEQTLGLHSILCKRLLEELLVFDLDGNFDCTSAMLIGELAKVHIQELAIESLSDINETDKEDFWNRQFF